MGKIKMFISLSMHGCKIEDEEDLPPDWDEMTKEEQNQYLDDALAVFQQNYVDGAVWVEEEP